MIYKSISDAKWYFAIDNRVDEWKTIIIIAGKIKKTIWFIHCLSIIINRWKWGKKKARFSEKVKAKLLERIEKINWRRKIEKIILKGPRYLNSKL